MCAACLLGTLAYRIVGAITFPDVRVLYYQTQARLDGLAVGAALAIFARQPAGLARLRPLVRPTLVVSAVILTSVLVRTRYLDPRDPIMVTVGFTALAAGFGAVLVAVLDRPYGRIHDVLAGRTLAFWVRYSYGLYVLHGPIKELMARYGIRAVGFFRISSEPVSLVA